MSEEKTYRELILDLENALKIEANLQNWSALRRARVAEKIASIRKTLAEHLDRVPQRKQPEESTDA